MYLDVEGCAVVIKILDYIQYILRYTVPTFHVLLVCGVLGVDGSMRIHIGIPRNVSDPLLLVL
jgi:hypothetical protein